MECLLSLVKFTSMLFYGGGNVDYVVSTYDQSAEWNHAVLPFFLSLVKNQVHVNVVSLKNSTDLPSTFQ